MIERRARQLARVPGFQAIPNKRITAAFAAELKALEEAGTEPAKAKTIALARIAATLAPRQVCHRHRAPRPSKSDNPEYCKSGALR